MNTNTKRVFKILSYSSLGLLLAIFLVIGVSAFILRDSISMTNGSCKILFADINSEDTAVQLQAHRFLDDAVRRVRELDNKSPIDEKIYSETVRDLSRICDEHPTKNLLQIQLTYSGLEKEGQNVR